MHRPVDEQGRGGENLAGRDTALDVATDPREHAAAGTVCLEALEVEAEVRRVATQVLVLERLLAPEQQLVHFPEAPLQGGRSGGSRCRERVRVDLRQWEVPEREPHTEPGLELG